MKRNIPRLLPLSGKRFTLFWKQCCVCNLQFRFEFMWVWFNHYQDWWACNECAPSKKRATGIFHAKWKKHGPVGGPYSNMVTEVAA